MTPLLPWMLVFILDGHWPIDTPLRFATEAECRTEGETLGLRMIVDLQLTEHTLDPWCVKDTELLERGGEVLGIPRQLE